MITSNPGGKPPAPSMNEIKKKGYSKRMLPEVKVAGTSKTPAASTAKKVKSFIKKYSQGMQ